MYILLLSTFLHCTIISHLDTSHEDSCQQHGGQRGEAGGRGDRGAAVRLRLRLRARLRLGLGTHVVVVVAVVCKTG